MGCYSGGPPFSDETMREIDQARNRFTAWINTFKFYDPDLDQSSMPEETPLVASVPESPPIQRLNQVEGNLISLRDTLKQHMLETKPRKQERSKKWQ